MSISMTHHVALPSFFPAFADVPYYMRQSQSDFIDDSEDQAHFDCPNCDNAITYSQHRSIGLCGECGLGRSS
jgi:predicted RNA-binding Zn-ribbon protein involved in translation (DUF1610 family)